MNFPQDNRNLPELSYADLLELERLGRAQRAEVFADFLGGLIERFRRLRPVLRPTQTLHLGPRRLA